jgi:hypothetical protein
MSTAPSGFQTPKTNWQTADVVQPSDLNRIEGNINAIEQGARTLDQAQAPSGNAGSLRQILSWLANRIRAITGMTNWYDAPPTTLTAAKSHIDAAAPHSGHATTTALDAHVAGTNVHGATSAATANRIIIRDAAGRAKVAAPSASDDIARKDTVDNAVALLARKDTLEAMLYDQYNLHMELYYAGHHSGASIAGMKGMTFDGFLDTKRVDTVNTTALVDTSKQEVSVPGSGSATDLRPVSAVQKAVPGLENNGTISGSLASLIDGDEYTVVWITSNDAVWRTGTVVLDLGSPQLVSAVKFLGRRPSETDIDDAEVRNIAVSLDGTNWTTVSTTNTWFSSTSKEWRTRNLPISWVRYVAFEMRSRYKADLNLYEVLVITTTYLASAILRTTPKTLEDTVTKVTAYVSSMIPTGGSIDVAVSADGGAHWENLTQEGSGREDPLFPQFIERKYSKALQYTGSNLRFRITLNTPSSRLHTPIVKRYGLYWE